MNANECGVLSKSAPKGVVVLAAALAVSGCASSGVNSEPNPADPWEGFNRRVFAFNDVLDRYALKPAAQGYRYITPDPLERGVSNFFDNLGEVRTVLNSLLQGKPANAGNSSMRFLMNTTFGLGGLLDPASHAGFTADTEDFGQTLAAWGVGEGPYVVLPFLGPSTVRDTAALPVDWYSYPLTYVEDDTVRYSLRGLELLDARAQLLDQEDLIRGDRYSFIRDAWLQRRMFEVNDGQLGEDNFINDDFDYDEDAFAE
ncbi:VacJ family lipoprotein [Halomonas denitrificans]|uniref:MlaA family lipoprotein n=1 Tax=Halomonas TaxID=2745 RepID=UPI001A8C6B33|nr:MULTISPECIES: VacJ family lipoprotein [Halomonas]MED5296706.1 VacJ family lipoprotein [Pseudomonadota bacterium]MBN8410741.1 VacJ family lipoprotein [Halomonas litopenaei]MBY5930655.1 VacJ family lipoprotein [Halomonas sp. DP8Y7-3]MBY5969289.1 VacJ family lipoprotein [Halomonas denitrificans]MBY5984916.1 VacJ family lipoprotein [Halomonas sp. DP5Y7-2]